MKLFTDKINAFTLIEIIMVISIIVILSSIAFPKYLKLRYSAQYYDMNNELNLIYNSLLLFYDLNRYYPDPDTEGLKSLLTGNEPLVTNKSLLLDPWNHEYHYELLNNDADIQLYSLGQDNLPGGLGSNQDVYLDLNNE